MVVVAVFLVLPLPLWRPIVDMRISGGSSSQLNAGRETAAPRRPRPAGPKVCAVPDGEWDRLGQQENEEPGSWEQ